MTSGTMAPPMIAVLRMPEKDPWYSATELSARETMIGHMIEANRPIAGKATTDTLAGPNKAADKQASAPTEVPIRSLRLSKIFSSNMPMRQPIVSNPQNQETTDAPVV